MDQEQVAGQGAPASGPNPLAELETFWREHYREFLRLLMSIGATMEDAEDSIGDVIEYMVRKKSWETLRDPKAYVLKTVFHAYYSRRERDRKRPQKEIKGGRITPELHIDCGLNVWEDEEWVAQMLNSLPKTQRVVVELTLAELKPKDIADQFGSSSDAIRQNLAHARKRLKANLGKDYRIDPGSQPAPAPRKEDTP